MATLNIPNSFVNGTPALASEVNANFNAVKTFAEALAAGTNLDDGSVTYAKLDAALQLLVGAADNASTVIAGQVFA